MILQPSLFPDIQSDQVFQEGDLPILPYPGNKRKYAGLFLGCGTYDTLLSPFLGSGAVELISDAPVKYVADCDHALLTQWRYILDGQWSDVLNGVRFWQKQVADEIATPAFYAYRGLPAGKRREVAKDHKLAYCFLQKMDSIWIRLLAALNSTVDLECAIADLVIRKLGFMAVVRNGKRGELNIKWMTDKLPSFVNFQGSQPNIKGKWRLHDDCFKAISAFKESGSSNAIALLDPPYWLPWVDGVRNQMTPAYRTHKPHSDETFELCVGSLKAVAEATAIRRIIYCNYFSNEMDSAVSSIADSHFTRFKRRPLKMMAKDRLDHAWILER